MGITFVIMNNQEGSLFMYSTHTYTNVEYRPEPVAFSMRYRNQILSLLTQKRHLRVEEVFGALKLQYPRLSAATVYRNLRQLEARKEAISFLHPDGSVRYEANTPQPHQHLVCNHCGTVIEISLGFINELALNLREKIGFTMDRKRLTIVGRCQNCSQ